MEKIVSDGEEESEENAVGEVKRERESVGGFGRGGWRSGRKMFFDGGVRVARGNIPARFHWELSGLDCH